MANNDYSMVIKHLQDGIYEVKCLNCRETWLKEDYGNGIYISNITELHPNCPNSSTNQDV